MPRAASERLDSWKEIAAYLGRDLRTVRRWEEEKGLPVHRVPGGERRAVFAYRAEIDAWLSDTETSNTAPAVTETAAIRTPAVNHPSASLGWWSKPIFTLRRITLAIILLALLGVIALSLVLTRARATLDKVTFSGNSVQGGSASGNPLWTYSFGQPLDEEGKRQPFRIQIVDLGANGQKQVLVMAPLNVRGHPNPFSDALFALSSDGKLLWRHDFNDNFQFNGNADGAPWFFGAMLVTDARVWSAVDSVLGSSSSVVKLDRDGRSLAQFVNWGHIHVLNHVHSATGSYVVAGGISNDCNCAMLTVLREDQPSGTSPHFGSGSPICENCPEGQPYRYFLFPRSEIAVATGTTYNQVTVILPREGGIRVWVTETGNNGDPPGADWEMYGLSPDFVPQGFEVSDHIPVLHKQLEAEGKIKHKVEQCPDLNHPRPVRMWSPQDGWKEIQVPRQKRAARLTHSDFALAHRRPA